MGYKLNKVYKNNPALDGEDFNTFDVEVSSNSVSDVIAMSTKRGSVCLEVSVFEQIYEDLMLTRGKR